MSDERNNNSRRSFLKSTLVAISTATMPSGVRSMVADDSGRRSGEAEKNLRFLHDSERAFLESAVDRLIPPDEHWPGGVQAGVVNYMDLQMAGPWARGELIYRHGPFRKGTPSQGYQLELLAGCP